MTCGKNSLLGETMEFCRRSTNSRGPINRKAMEFMRRAKMENCRHSSGSSPRVVHVQVTCAAGKVCGNSLAHAPGRGPGAGVHFRIASSECARRSRSHRSQSIPINDEHWRIGAVRSQRRCLGFFGTFTTVCRKIRESRPDFDAERAGRHGPRLPRRPPGRAARVTRDPAASAQARGELI
jgi:hypothetical protein